MTLTHSCHAVSPLAFSILSHGCIFTLLQCIGKEENIFCPPHLLSSQNHFSNVAPPPTPGFGVFMNNPAFSREQFYSSPSEGWGGSGVLLHLGPEDKLEWRG